MAIFNSKWILIVVILILVVVVLLIIGRKSVHAEIIINDTPAKVWSVLMDKSSYTEWNTVLIPIRGELIEGNTVQYEFIQDENNKSVIPSKVKRMTENKLLNQGGGMPGILTYNHKYILEKVESGTKVIIHEDYRGVAVPFWNPAPVEKAYERLCEDLKRRMEKLKAE